MIHRIIEDQIKKRLFNGRAVLLWGARRVGKTVLVKKLVEEYKEGGAKYIHCELLKNKEVLESGDIERMMAYWGRRRLVVLDEAQNVNGIGETLKLLVDIHPEVQIIATGSSSFELANHTKESMVGRIEEYTMYPLSYKELVGNGGYMEGEREIGSFLRYGSYPEVWQEVGREKARRLEHIVSEYLYKDVLLYAGIKNSGLIKDLLQLLARQVGSEVSYNELAVALKIDPATVRKYIDILEQNFVIFRLRAFSRNLRKEISKAVKIYFWDVGVRNNLIQAYGPMELRVDAGAVWENWWIVERIKALRYAEDYRNGYFWRTHDQHELDYVEEFENRLTGYEIKWGEGKVKTPKDFLRTYPGSQLSRVGRDNYWNWLV